MKTCENGFEPSIAQAIEEMKAEQGKNFSLERINLAELERRTGVSRARLRRLKANNFQAKPHASKGKRPKSTVLSGYSSVLDALLTQGIANSSVLLQRLQAEGYTGSLTTVKRYIQSHRSLIPAKRQTVAPQGSRGSRYTTAPGEAYQMDWGFTKVADYTGNEFQAACFAMICHHCGQRYIEFFPNAKQENLFIGMIHAFRYMGVPRYVLTDNMKSVVIRRDFSGFPIWQKDYEAFMGTVGFQTKLCKPRHPFTKGKVERLVRFVKENFLIGRVFWNVTDLNRAASLSQLEDSLSLRFYLAPERKISFDGFINYEGRRFGVPYSYRGSTARIAREDDMIYIYSADARNLLATYEVTWSKRDRFCKDQYLDVRQPEELPTAPVRTTMTMLEEPKHDLTFDKFDFDKGVVWDD